MRSPATANVFAALEATWPAAHSFCAAGVIVRDGRGGGKRVSAATIEGSVYDLDAAEASMTALGQTPLFMIRGGNDSLDAELAERGYTIADPTVLYTAPVAVLCGEVPPVTTFTVWEPLAAMLEIWAAGGIGPERVAVMERVAAIKTGLFGRLNDRPAGAGFVAHHAGIAMVHALEVRPTARRSGLGRHMMRTAVHWAETQGAADLAVAVTRRNAAARALYASLGMEVVGQYHYRIKATHHVTPAGPAR